MTGNIEIRPRVPPELGDDPQSFTITGHPNCVKFLSRRGITEGILLTWTPPPYLKLTTEPQASAIYIPSLKQSSGVMVLKLVSNLKSDPAVINLVDKITEQMQAIDLFISSLNFQEIVVSVRLLLIVTNSKSDKLYEGRISVLERNIGEALNHFQAIEVHTDLILRKNDCGPLDEKQEKRFREALDQCMAPANSDCEKCDSVIDALIQSTPEFISLQLSTDMYNCNNCENKEGFKLNNPQKVRETYMKFFKSATEKIMFLPDLDSFGHQILNSTCKEKGNMMLQKADGFLGEYVNFTECLLSRLREPKGLLIRGYSKVHLDTILTKNFRHIFEFDWILCSRTKIFGFEVGRTDKIMQPKTAIQRKIDSVFCTSFPKFRFILVSLLKEMQMPCEDIRKFANKHFGFVIYFPNISKSSIVSFLKTRDAEQQIKLLNSTPKEILSQVYVLTTEDENFDLSVPSFHKFNANGSMWELVSASLIVADLFGSETMESVSSPNEMPKNSDCRVLPEIQYLSGLLSFGFLLKKFSNDDKDDENFARDSQKAQQKFHSDLVLSPQQKRILDENKRFMLLVGEPGCGKTSLLLARALDAAEDAEIEKIIYVVPRNKIKLKEWLQKFVCQSNCEPLKKKWNLFEACELDLSLFSEKVIGKSILLADELYLNSTHEWSEKDTAFLKQCRLIELMPLLKQCWLAQTEAGQRDKKCFTNFSQVIPPLFEIEVLNVLFRSSWHIGSFSTKLLHQMKNISMASAQTFGCIGASQFKVETGTFLDNSDLMNKIKLCLTLNPKFNSNRFAIVISSSDSQQCWESSFVELNYIVTQVFVVTEDVSFRDIPFTGIEVASVIIIIDYVDHHKKLIESSFLSLVLLAASRAQFELHFVIKEIYAEKLETLFNLCDNKKQDPVVLAARMGLPLELDKILDNKLNHKQFAERGNALLAIAVLRDDLKLLKAVATCFPAG